MGSRAITPRDVTWIVKIMCKDSLIYRKRETLCLALGISMGRLTDISRSKLADDTRVFLTQVLDTWISNCTEPTFEKLVEVLRDEELNLIADEIVKKQLELPLLSPYDFEEHCRVSSTGIWFGVPDDVHMFTGRVEYMKELHESIVAQNSADAVNDMTVITAVCGMGGVGKSSLTIHYAWTFVNKFYVNVVWINSESINMITNSFKTLARKIGQNTASELGDVVQEVYEYFGNSRTLIVFDNVESYEDIKPYLPNRSPNMLRPYVLVSSRKRDWHLRTHLIDLNLFGVEESVEFFKGYLKLKSDQELDYAEKISVELQNLPLALRQAGAYIKVQHKERKTSLIEEMKSYLETFHANFISIVKFEHWVHTTDIYEKTVYSTLTLNMSKLKKQNQLTETIMEFISYLNPENIPVKLLYNVPNRGLWKRITNPTIERSEVDSAVKLLADFSLITKQNERLDTISVHRLLQKVARCHVQSKYNGTQFNWIISWIKSPLELNNYDNYEDLCLVHSLALREQIPTSVLEKKNVQSFLELIVSKQRNSIDQRLKILKDMLQREAYEELLDQILSITKESGMSNNTADLLLIRLVNLICSEIRKDYKLSCNSEKILKRCKMIMEIVDGFHFSFDDECSLDFRILLAIAEDLCGITVLAENISLTTERKEVIATLYRVLNIVFECFKIHKSSLIDSWRHIPYISDMIMMLINLLTELGKGEDILEFILYVNDLNDNNQYNQSAIYYLGVCTYKSSHHGNMINFRDELLRKSLNFYKKYINDAYQHVEFTYFIKVKDNVRHKFRRSGLVSQCAVGIINCMVELNRSSEIIDSLSEVTAILHEYGKFLFHPVAKGEYEKYEFHVVSDLLFTTGRSTASENVKNELIQHSLYLSNTQYELEKSLPYTDSLITVRRMIEIYLQLHRLTDIINLCDDFQQSIGLKGTTAMSIMSGLCDILLRNGRDSNYKIKYHDLIAQCLKISNECLDTVKDGVYKLTFRCYVATCEFLLGRSLDTLIQHSDYIFSFVQKYGDTINLDYLKVLVKVAVELRHAGQYAKALYFFEYLHKIYLARADSPLFQTAGCINDLSGVIREDLRFERALSVLPFVMLEDL